jgi:putative ABC transport system substrate-binding protein
VSGPDPVRTGLVSSLNRPGGNLTGVAGLTADLTPKRLGLLRDAVPQTTVVAVFLGRPPNQVDPDFQLRSAQAAGRSAGLQVIGVQAGEESEFEAAFASAVREGAQALLVSTNIYFINHREPLVALAAKYKLPAIYQHRDYATAGGLMSYGAITTDVYRQAGVYAGRILKGEKPGDLPVVLPTKFEFVINLKTAKALGLTIPETLLATADQVIE